MTSIHFRSNSDEWATPPWLFRLLDDEFHFVIDAAATAENALCSKYFTVADDGLQQRWSSSTFANPPFGRAVGRWVAKAAHEAKQGRGPIVCLVAARPDTRWWHESAMQAAEIRLIKGRLRFGGATNAAPFPSAALVFLPGWAGPSRFISWDILPRRRAQSLRQDTAAEAGSND